MCMGAVLYMESAVNMLLGSSACACLASYIMLK